MKRVAVSACLLGKKCRYDGSDRYDRELETLLEGCEVIPFCPEEEILGTPRETIDIVEDRVVGSQSGHDYTDQIVAQAKEFVKSHPRIDQIYSKSKSPSCALCSARIYDKEGRLLADDAEGIFIKELKKAYKKAKFEERSPK
ncbi:MAG: hypothetical protein C6H99_07010 [Epsilonproteobacteria bacterium]|nr:hypothetical protein [Campylobacterota bacterium]NPA64635.1 DUF523 domain-containing protein [Campylobacterota bacterium]